MLRWLALAVFPLMALLGACSSGSDQSGVPAEATQTTASRATSTVSPETPGTASAAVDASRFVFGASPGKPVVYWIHTDW